MSSKRYEHFLRPSRAEAQPSQGIAVEATAQRVAHPEIPGLYLEELTGWKALRWRWDDGQARRLQEHTGATVSQWWGLVDHSLRDGVLTWCWCMPAGRVMTLLGLWEELESGRVYLTGGDPRCPQDGDRAPHRGRPGYCVLEDPPTVIHCRRGGRAGSLKIVDVRNYGVATAGEIAPDGDLVGGIHRWVCGIVALLRSRGWGTLQATSASQSMHTFRRAFLRHSILCHTYDEVLDHEQRSYFGGRCEAGYVGRYRGRCHHLDYRAFYPSLCRTLQLPVRLVDYAPGRGLAGLPPPQPGTGRLVFATVRCRAPAFPYRRGTDIIYPTGRWTATLCGPEYDLAVELGAVEAVHAVATYDLAPALAEYSEAMLDLRSESSHNGDAAGERLAKALAVGLIGKLGQRSKRWIDRPQRVAAEPYESWYAPDDAGGLKRWRSVGWHVQEEVDDGLSADANLAMAAWITSAGRVQLWRDIQTAGPRHVLYYDTDSLYVDDAGLSNLQRAGRIDPLRPGYLRHLGAESGMEIWGIKHYRFGDRLVCSGTPRADAPLRPDQTSYYSRAWLGQSIVSGHRPRAEVALRQYPRPAPYRHGVVGADGWVKPLAVEGD